jgi:hypothetical protein
MKNFISTLTTLFNFFALKRKPINQNVKVENCKNTTVNIYK